MRWLFVGCSFLAGMFLGLVAAFYGIAVITSSWPQVVPPGWVTAEKEASR